MAIKIECGDCGKTYTVKDEMEGKKIRCKECSAVIVVRSESGDEWNEEVEEEFLPPVRKTPTKKNKMRRQSSSGGLPLPIQIALICLVLVIGLSVLEVIGKMMIELPNIPGGNDALAARRAGKIFGGMLRILIQGAIFMGILKGSPGYRIPAIVMAVLSCLVFGIAMVGLIALGITDILIWGPLLLMIVLRMVIIGCLVSPSGTHHFRE